MISTQIKVTVEINWTGYIVYTGVMKLPSRCKQKHTDNSESTEVHRNSKQFVEWTVVQLS